MTTGAMIVGLGGNNGSTLFALSHLARLSPVQLYGSSVLHGSFRDMEGSFHTIASLFPEETPALAQLPIGGWDVDADVPTMAAAMARAGVLAADSQAALVKAFPEEFRAPILPGVWRPGVTCFPQRPRADAHPAGETDAQAVSRLGRDMQAFAAQHRLQHLVVIYSGSVERTVSPKEPDAPPSALYARAADALFSPKLRVTFVNASAQDTRAWSAATPRKWFLTRDLATGQTRQKKHLVSLFHDAGIPLQAIVSNNELGNRDGEALQSRASCAAKLATKASMTGSMCAAAPTLYPPGTELEHLVRINYVAAFGDDKRASDEYLATLTGGKPYSICIQATCPDTLLATPVLYDIICILAILGVVAPESTNADVNRLLAYYMKFQSSDPITSQLGDNTPLHLFEQLRLLQGFLLSVSRKGTPRTRYHEKSLLRAAL